MNRTIIAIILVIAILLPSCSTTKRLAEGETRLKSNVVTISNKKEYPDYKGSEIEDYVRQKSNTYFIKTKKGGWNPFLYVYNWDNGKGKGWDKFVTKLGQPPVVFDSLLVDDSKDNIRTHLEHLGYYNSVIKDSIAVKKRNAVVFYDVTLGKQYPIKSVKYIVDDPILEDIIKEDSVNSLIKVGAPLSAELLDAETERSAAHVRNLGYFEFSKNYYFFTADTISVKDSALLEIMVRNYTRNESPEDARPHKKFYFGKVYIQPISDMTRYRVSLAQKIPLVLDTIPYKDIYVLYDKKKRIRPSVLYDMNLLYPGNLYSETMVNKTYQRFSNLHLYNSVNVELTKVDNSNIVDCDIVLSPAKVHGYKVNLEVSTNSTGLMGISPELSYTNRNIFKGGEWLSLSVMGNFQFSVKNSTRATEFGANMGLSFPTFVLVPNRFFKTIVPRTDISLTYNFQKRPEYTRNMIGGKLGWSWNSSSNKYFYKISPIQLNIVNLPVQSPDFIESLTNPFVREAYKNHFELGLGFNMIYTSDPNINPKKSFFRSELQFDIAGNLMSAFNDLMPTDKNGYHTIWKSPYSQFVRGELSLAYTWKFGKDNKQALAVRGLGGIGYAYGNSSKMPFERLFWSGGSNSLRGWTGRGVGPGSSPVDTTFSIPNQTGDMRLEANIEYRFPLFSIFRGAVFFDWGNVWNLARLYDHTSPDEREGLQDSYFTFDNMFRTCALNTGLGLRLDIDFVVIRLDWGIKLYDPIRQDWQNISRWFKRGGFAFQFGIGYPF